MLEKLKKANKDIEILSVFDDSFKIYGEVLSYDTTEIVAEGKKLEMPEGVIYKPSLEAFEKLAVTVNVSPIAMLFLLNDNDELAADTVKMSPLTITQSMVAKMITFLTILFITLSYCVIFVSSSKCF